MTDSFTSVFPGSPVQPSEVSYRLIALTANVTLSWPQQSVDTTDIVARWNDVNAAGVFNITLGPANQISTGQDAVFNNISSVAFNILANDGTTIANVPTSNAIYIICVDNSTVAGSWRVVTFGAGVSQANAASLAGAGLMAAASVLNLNIPIQAIPTNYTTVSGDRATVLNWTGGAGTLTPADPGSAGFGNGWLCEIRNSGSGALTVDPTVGNIDGNSTKTLNQSESCILHTDGANYFTVGYGRSVVSSFTRLVVSVAGSADVNLTSAQAQNQVLEFTGALTGDISVTVPANVAEYFVYNHTTGAHTLTFKTISGTGIVITQGNRQIVHCDGTNIVLSNSSGTGTVTSIVASTGLTGGTITATGTIALANTAVTPGSYTAANITVDAQGRITLAANGAAGSVTSITAGAGLSGGVITTVGTISLPTTGVAAATYTYPSITVDTFGRITAASSLSGTGRLIGIQAFLTPGSFTYTPTATTARIIVELQGGGGGSSSCGATTGGQNSLGSAGGGGAWASLLMTSGFSGQTVTIGPGGAGGTIGNAGSNGNASTFVSLTAGGGGGGAATFAGGATAGAVVNIGASGGTATGGNINVPGGAGGISIAQGVFCAGGLGGNSYWGAGGSASFTIGAKGTPVAGRNFGGGGSAPVNSASQTASVGAAGAQGACLIYEYS